MFFDVHARSAQRLKSTSICHKEHGFPKVKHPTNSNFGHFMKRNKNFQDICTFKFTSSPQRKKERKKKKTKEKRKNAQCMRKSLDINHTKAARYAADQSESSFEEE